MTDASTAQAAQLHATALAAVDRGDSVFAVQCLVDAITLEPDVALYHRNLGELCRRLGRLDEAVLAGQHAVALERRDPDAHANLGLAWADSHQWAAAVAAYRDALALNPNNGFVWNNLGAALLQASQASDAEHAFRQAIALNPAHAEAQINLAMCYSRQGNLQAAHACLALAEQSAPGLAQKLGVVVGVRGFEPPASTSRT